MWRGTAIVVAGVLAVLGAVGVAQSASAPVGPDPVVREWPAWPYLSHCEGLPFYAPAAFSGRAEAEMGSLPSELALLEFIEHGDLPWLRGTRHWRKVAEDEDQAEFARGSLSDELEWLSFQQEDGAWMFDGYASGCDPTSIVGEGWVFSWSLLDPKPPNTAVRRIQIRLGSGPCSSGKPHTPRARLVFREWGRQLLLTVWVKALPPRRYTCQGVKEPPLKVTLPRKIKLSKLFDGATYPPKPALKPGP
jgi:hypothetical protein